MRKMAADFQPKVAAKPRLLILLAAFGMGLLILVMVLLPGSRAFSQTTAYAVTWDIQNPPTKGWVGLPLTLQSIKVTNTGTQKWASSGNDAVRLGYRWFSSEDKPLTNSGDTAWQDLRADLPSDLPQGGSVIFPQFKVALPGKPGDYNLHFDLIQGTNGYFTTKGATDSVIKIPVLPKDTVAPTVSVNPLPLFEVSTTFTVTWTGNNFADGSGVANYDVQYKTYSDKDWTDWLQATSQNSAQFSGDNGKIYMFRARAADKTGNISAYPASEQAVTHVNILPPTARIASLASNSPTAFLVRWTGFDSVDGSDNQLFDVQYKDGDNGSWQDWLTFTPATAGVFSGQEGHTYFFRCRATNYAGLRSDYSDIAQASTTVSAVLDSIFNNIASSAGISSTTTTTTPSATISGTVSPTISGTLNNGYGFHNTICNWHTSTTVSGTTSITGTIFRQQYSMIQPQLLPLRISNS